MDKKNIKQPPKGLIKYSLIALAVMIVISAIASVANPESNTNTDNANSDPQSQQEQQDAPEQPEAAKETKTQPALADLRLPSFEDPTITEFDDGVTAQFSGIGNDISITVFDTGTLDFHEGGFYNVDRGSRIISDIEVITGYIDSDEYTAPFSSLSFDFEYDGKVYSGEITDNVVKAGESAEKKKIDDSLVSLVAGIINLQ